MLETTDTRPNMLEIGEYNFTTTKPCVKRMSKADNPKPYYEFSFETMVEGELKEHKEIRMPWQCADILRALGCKEEKPGVFSWDKDQIVGKRFKAKIIHESDRKDPTKTRAKITEPVEEMPF